ncbi:plant UBX domain-containing protein 10-like [Quillaja saponaria]|uniref:Plant UBX domain-containing protein 10-like n=1 Tax=Quillaja saponaria TaxID=32244 RepID=A0AAD7P839_QUISA|nr:plant UBX domain-containing protein 10-like [Quillaja saponaria]
MSRRTRDDGVFRRMVNLPRSIMGNFSRAIGHGIACMGRGGRRNQLLPSNFQFQHPQDSQILSEDYAFLSSLEQQYGSSHPFFYACSFMEALKIAEQDHKFLFIYLHLLEHPFTSIFCKETLCSDLVVQFLNVNFICWGSLTDRGEGFQMVATLQPASFPFCAVIAPAPSDCIAILQQIEGPISPVELVEILQRTVEEQGMAFGSDRAKQEEKIRADRRLREEQDAAYLAALQIDKGKEIQERIQKPTQAAKTTNYEKLGNNSTSKQYSKPKDSTTRTDSQHKETARTTKDLQPTQILIRFPNGERREQTFFATDKIQSIFRYIDSLNLPGFGNYRLVSNFPTKVYGVDQMGVTLKDSGLHPRASLFVEPV